MKTVINDYIILGYRCYRLTDFDVSQFVKQLTTTQRANHLEILVIDNVVFVKTTYKYERKNPYVKK